MDASRPRHAAAAAQRATILPARLAARPAARPITHSFARPLLSRGWRRSGALLAALAVVAGVTVAGAVGTATPAAADPPTSLTVTAEATPAERPGESIAYALTAENPGADVQADRVHHVSFRAVLPAGLAYMAGSSYQFSGASLLDAYSSGNFRDWPDPTVVATPAGEQVLIWADVSDLPGDARVSLAFYAVPDYDVLPVGTAVSVAVEAYANGAARQRPAFDAQGDAIPSSYTAAGSGSTETQIAAITIMFDQLHHPDVDDEMLRGAYSSRYQFFTVSLWNNVFYPTNDIELVYYLPAAMEYLHCGGIDNGTTSEYGGRSLAENPQYVGGPCRNPQSLETVDVPAGAVPSPDGGYLDAGIYTKITWEVPDLAAGGYWRTGFRAVVPQRENALFSDPAPAAACGDVAGTWVCPQAANLDNNTGPSTREQNSTAGTEDGEQQLTSVATVTAEYQGPVAQVADRQVAGSASKTVTAEDFAVTFSPRPDDYVSGNSSSYVLQVAVSEYVGDADLVITAEIPAGLCPTADLETCTTDPAAYGAFPYLSFGNASVDGYPWMPWRGGSGSAEVTSITANPDGSYALVFTAHRRGNGMMLSIDYPVLRLTGFDSHNLSGDESISHVSLVGRMTTRADVNAPAGDLVPLDYVRDAAEKKLVATPPHLYASLRKQDAGPYSCDDGEYWANPHDWNNGDGHLPTDDEFTFDVGDRVCFTVHAHIENGARNLTLTDYLPPYLTFENAQPTAYNTVTSALDTSLASPGSGGVISWTVGDPVGDDHYAEGTTDWSSTEYEQNFDWQVSAIVTQAPPTDGGGMAGNMVTASWMNTAGAPGIASDAVYFTVAGSGAPSPDTSLGLDQVTGIDEPGNDAAGEATIGESVTYTVTVTVPAYATVHQGLIADPMPDGIELVGATATLDGTVLGDGASTLAGGEVTWTVNDADTPGADGVTLDLGDAYVNGTGVPQVFELTVTGRVADAPGNTHGTSRENTASFARADDQGTSLPEQSASTTLTIVEPDPSVVLTDTRWGSEPAVHGGQTVAYSLVVVNAAGRPPLHDATVVACIPEGMTLLSPPGYDSGQEPTTEPGDGGNGCATGATALRWAIGGLASGATTSAGYTVAVEDDPPGGHAYRATATLSGGSMPSGGRQYTANAVDTVRAEGAGFGKDTSTPARAIGETAEFTVAAVIPADADLFDAVIVDTLPAGLDPVRVTTTGASCVLSDDSPCAGSFSPTALTPDGQTIGWFLGDLTAAGDDRTITITYTVPVAEVSPAAPAAGDLLENGAVLGWNSYDDADPAGIAGLAPELTSEPAAAAVTVTEPGVTVVLAASVDPADEAEPGDAIGYTVTVTNGTAGDPSLSTAHEVTVSVAVPAGLDVGIIGNGGSYDAVTRTVTWTLASLVAGDAAVLTYDVTVAATAAPGSLVTAASVDGYCSVAFGGGQACADVGGRQYSGPGDTAAITVSDPPGGGSGGSGDDDDDPDDNAGGSGGPGGSSDDGDDLDDGADAGPGQDSDDQDGDDPDDGAGGPGATGVTSSSSAPNTTAPAAASSGAPTVAAVPTGTSVGTTGAVTLPRVPTVDPVPRTNAPRTTVRAPHGGCVELAEPGFVPQETVAVRVIGADGQYELAAGADGDGVVRVCVRVSERETLTIEMLGVNRHVVREVAVLEAGGELPMTGVAVQRYLTWALLLAGGGALLLAARRRDASRGGGGTHR